jgi:uncharacterized membrane protein
MASDLTQKDLNYQYSLPILPFLIVAAIATLEAGRGLLKTNREIILWSLATFLFLANYGHFTSVYLDSIDTWFATKTALTQIDRKGAVVTTNYIAPHLTNRKVITLPTESVESSDLQEFKYILLNLRHPGIKSSTKIATNIINKLKNTPNFQLKFQQDDVFLFKKITK